MKIYNIFGRPEEREPIHMSDVLAAADARPAPSPLSATDRLQRNLERTVSESTARAEVLRQEIAAREIELADVLRAADAARVALGNLTETGHVPYAEEPVVWPFAPIKLDQEHVFDESGRPIGVTGRITEEDLSAACGLALEEEMSEKLGRFGHHPDPANDFCVEVECLQSMAWDIDHKIAEHPDFQERLDRALEFRVGGDEIAVAAKGMLRKLVARNGK